MYLRRAHKLVCQSSLVLQEKNYGVTSVRLEIAFDENVLKLTEVSDGGILGKANHSNLLKSPYVLSWENDMLRENITSTGVIATLTFEVDDNATQKEYPVTVVRAEVLNTNIEDVECNITDGSISVTKKEVEDVSSGEVTTTIGGSGSYTCKKSGNNNFRKYRDQQNRI